MRPVCCAIAILLVAVYGAITAPAAIGGQAVDLELALAVDTSWSVDTGEAMLQRKGYVDAFRHPSVIQAIENGRLGRIAVAYVEWSSANNLLVVADWTVIEDRESAYKFANKLVQKPPGNAPGTSISGAIDYSVPLIQANGFDGKRRVIDISGDGPNNSGDLVVAARERAVKAGMTINGLPILDKGDNKLSYFNIPDLDLYYQNCVIGGPGAFVVVANTILDFAHAVRRKLILEIAGLTPPGHIRDADAGIHLAGAGQVAQLKPQEAPPCDIGESLWRNRYLLNL
ncbi:MAG TPA: DUF1194 domain-containing protein [Rhodospirillales bacterium]|nr:DUF1194 domain-containing protein [Rhodospirillales bacterium]